MKHLACIIISILFALPALAQEYTVQNRPYTDLRKFHFGIVVGTHLQDLEFNNVGPQVITDDNGVETPYVITTDQDRWDMGFHVGVLGEFRLSDYFQFRVAPTLYFGTRHISFHNMDPEASDSLITHQQTLKSVYIGCSADLIIASKRLNNHRPYIMLGINPMINLTNSSNDYIKLKRYDVCIEVGLGCDFYLPFFKLRPELKFVYSLTNSLDKDNASQLRDETMLPYAQSINKATSKMIALSFYFE